jgi:hypothetical protein
MARQPRPPGGRPDRRLGGHILAAPGGAITASSTGTLRGLLSQSQALADVLDGWASLPVRPLLCVHGRWPARTSRLFSRIRVAPLGQLADVVRSGSTTTPDAVELASARLLAVLRPAA